MRLLYLMALVAALGGCNWLEQRAAAKSSRKLAAAHLDGVHTLLREVESTITKLPENVSPAKGSAVDLDPDALEVEVSCWPPEQRSEGYPACRGHARLRGATSPPDVSYFRLGVEPEEGSSASSEFEEFTRVPSTLATGAIDLCIRRKATGVQVCVAYRNP